MRDTGLRWRSCVMHGARGVVRTGDAYFTTGIRERRTVLDRMLDQAELDDQHGEHQHND